YSDAALHTAHLERCAARYPHRSPHHRGFLGVQDVPGSRKSQAAVPRKRLQPGQHAGLRRPQHHHRRHRHRAGERSPHRGVGAEVELLSARTGQDALAMTPYRTPRRLRLAGGAVLVAALVAPILSTANRDDLREGFQNPPAEARMRCYWWWLNGNTTAAAITRDLEQMKAKGYGGALLVDADGSGQRGNQTVAPGPLFGS